MLLSTRRESEACQVLLFTLFVTCSSLIIAKLPHAYGTQDELENRFPVQSQGYLLQLFEEALLSNSQNVYNLAKIFFDPDGKSPARVNISVTIAVHKIKNDSTCICSQSAFVTEKCHYFNAGFESIDCSSTQICSKICHYDDECWIRPNGKDITIWIDINNRPGTLSDLLLNDNIWRNVMFMEYVSSMLLSGILSISQNTPNSPLLWQLLITSLPHEFQLELTLDLLELDYIPCDDDVTETIKQLLVWAKAYARTGRKSCERFESDRGQTSTFITNETMVSNTTLALFFILNILTTLLGCYFISKLTSYFLSSPSTTACYLYWSLVILVGFLNLCCIYYDIGSCFSVFFFAYMYSDINNGHNVQAIPIGYLKITVVIIFLIFEPYFAWRATKTIRIPVNLKLFVLCSCCCCCCCYCCCRRHCSRWKARVVHTLSLCHILWFMHRLASAVVMSVILIVNNPPETITTLTLITLTFMCAVLMLFSCFRIVGSSTEFNLSTFIRIIVCSCMWIVVMALLILVLLLYMVFLTYGLNYSSVGGFLLSVVPPTIIFVLGIYLKKRFNKMPGTHAHITGEPTEQDNNSDSEVLPILTERTPSAN